MTVTVMTKDYNTTIIKDVLTFTKWQNGDFYATCCNGDQVCIPDVVNVSAAA